METKIKEKTENLKEIIEMINQKRNQITQLETEGLMIQGEIRLLREQEDEKKKAGEKTTIKK